MGIAVVICGWVLALYQPWQSAPLTPTDFSDFLPLLQSHSSFVARWQAMSAFYAAEGRFFPLTIAWIVARWSWFGLAAPAWQTATVLLLLCTVGAVYALLRRLGSSAAGALLGTLLFVFSAAIRELWLRPQLGDNVGLIFVLGAVWAGTYYQQTRHPVLAAASIALPLLAATWTKETFVAAMPFVLGVSLCWQGNDRWAYPRATVRSATIVAMVGIITALGLLPILSSRRGVNQAAYAAQYGFGAMRASHIPKIVGAMLIPSAGGTLSVSGLVFSVLLVVGWAHALKQPPRHSKAIALVVALSLPVAGAAIYLPWPTFYPHYASAFLLGPAYLTAIATTTALSAKPRLMRWLPVVAALSLVAEGSRAGFGAAQEALGTRRILGASVAFLPRAGEASAVVLPGSAPMYAPGWFEVRFARYARAVFSHPLPPVLGSDCAGAARTWRSQQDIALLVLAWRCGSEPGLPAPTWKLVQPYRHLSFMRLRVVTDSMEVDIWAPRQAAHSPNRIH